MPMRLGELGLRSAARMAPAAFWASWTNKVTVELTNGQNLDGCVHELAVAPEQLDRRGFVDRPVWADLQREAPVAVSVEPGEWQHGWQHHASSSSEHHYRETVMFAQSCASDMAYLRSHSGPGAGDVFHGSPSSRFRGPARTLPNADLGEVMSLFTSLMLNASAVPHSTEWDVTEQRAHVQVV